MEERTDASGERPAGEERGNFLLRAAWVFFSPARLYREIEDRPAWWEPWIWISILGIAGAYLFKPVQIALISLNQRGLSPEDLEKSIEAMRKFYALGYLTAPVGAILQAFIVAAVGYLVAALLASGVNFKKYFTLYLYSNIIASVGMLLSIALVRMRGVETIESISDATVSFGLDFLVPEGHGMLAALASSINVFAVWSYVVIALGLESLFGFDRRRAVLAVVPVWLIFALFSLLGALFTKAL